MVKKSAIDPRIKNLLHLLGYSSLYPPQELALSRGLLEGRNLLVTTPTASGKTLIAIIAAINILRKGLKVVYLTPLRALTTEKYQEFLVLDNLELFDRKIKVKVASSDYNSSGRELADGDVIVLTNEKMDSLIRHRTEWIYNVGLFVADEVHLIGERERGPTLEMMLTKLRNMNLGSQILAMSATIANSLDIAKWLDCDLVENNWRPTKLIEGVYKHGTLRMNDGQQLKINTSFDGMSSAAIDIAIDCLDNGGQALIFAETRKRTSSLATKAAEAVYKRLNKLTRKMAASAAAQILDKGDDAEVTRTLSQLVAKGVGFHHAGLAHSSREIVEKSFKTGVIKLLAATPTLSAGVNLPARRVILASVLRYDSDYGGSIPISILEYKQICGRAGRPRYDSFGEAVIVADSGISAEEIYDHYILGTPEPVGSQLTNDRTFRIHVLSIISTLPGIKRSEIYDIFGSTLLAQFQRKTSIALRVDSAISYLENEDLVKSKNNRYIPTEFGKRISLLYIDPLTGVEFKKSIESVERTTRNKNSIGYSRNEEYDDHNNNDCDNTHTLGFLHLITNNPDFYPKFPLRKKDFEEFRIIIEQHNKETFYQINEYECSRSVLALYRWINEASYKVLSDTIGIEPGDMHRIVEVSDWLAYSLYEVAKVIKREDLLLEIRDLRLRIKYGVRKELLPLVILKGIGRVRARSLYEAGLKDIAEIAHTSEARLSAISNIGPTVARKLKEQLKNKS
jgi:helicase